MTKSDNYDSYYVTDILDTASEIKLLYSGVELQLSAVASSQLSLVLSLKNWRLYMLLASYDCSKSLKNSTNVIPTLSSTTAEKLLDCNDKKQKSHNRSHNRSYNTFAFSQTSRILSTNKICLLCWNLLK